MITTATYIAIGNYEWYQKYSNITNVIELYNSFIAAPLLIANITVMQFRIIVKPVNQDT